MFTDVVLPWDVPPFSPHTSIRTIEELIHVLYDPHVLTKELILSSLSWIERLCFWEKGGIWRVLKRTQSWAARKAYAVIINNCTFLTDIQNWFCTFSVLLFCTVKSREKIRKGDSRGSGGEEGGGPSGHRKTKEVVKKLCPGRLREVEDRQRTGDGQIRSGQTSL